MFFPAGKLLSSFLVMTATFGAIPTPAATVKPDYLASSANLARDRLIVKGIQAYRGGHHEEAVYLLRNFLNPHKMIVSPLEKTGIAYLALAYLAVENKIQAEETIQRAIAVGNYESAELAHLEYIAGRIAIQQQQFTLANRHWEIARRLYLQSSDRQQWRQITLKLIKNYQQGGELLKVKQLRSELSKL